MGGGTSAQEIGQTYGQKIFRNDRMYRMYSIHDIYWGCIGYIGYIVHTAKIPLLEWIN